MYRLILLALAVAWALPFGLSGCAEQDNKSESYPDRPVKLVVPFGAGGASDTFARVMQKAIAEEGLLPEPIVIVNRGGAGGTIGSRFVKDSQPDGYTIMLLHQAVLTARYADKVEYGPQAFEPIAGTGEDSEVIVVRGDSPLASFDELIRATQDRPDQVKFAVNMGAPTHFTAQRVESAAGNGSAFRFVQTGGGADRYHALAGGHVDATIFSIGEFLSFDSDELPLKALAVFDEKRNEAIPDVPTAREAGINVVSANMQYWWAPKGTPRDRIDVLAGVIEKAMASEQVQAALQRNQTKPLFLNAEQVVTRLTLAEQELNVEVKQAPDYLGYLPHVILGACLVLGLGFLAQSLRPGAAVDQGKATPTPPLALPASIGFVVLTIGYVLLLGLHVVDFRVATLCFVVVAGVVLAGTRPKTLFTVAVISVILAFGTHFVIAEFLAVDLP